MGNRAARVTRPAVAGADARTLAQLGPGAHNDAASRERRIRRLSRKVHRRARSSRLRLAGEYTEASAPFSLQRLRKSSAIRSTSGASTSPDVSIRTPDDARINRPGRFPSGRVGRVRRGSQLRALTVLQLVVLGGSGAGDDFDASSLEIAPACACICRSGSLDGQRPVDCCSHCRRRSRLSPSSQGVTATPTRCSLRKGTSRRAPVVVRLENGADRREGWCSAERSKRRGGRLAVLP